MKAKLLKKWMWVLFPIVLSILLSALVPIVEEILTELGYLKEVIFIGLLVIFIRTIFNYEKRRSEIKKRKLLRIKGQYENLGKVILIGLGLVCIIFVRNAFGENDTLEMINFLLLGIILLVEGFTFSGNLYLEQVDAKKNKVRIGELSIKKEDKIIELSSHQMKILKADKSSEELLDIVLTKESAIEIKGWLEANLKNSTIEYYWKSKDLIERI